MVKGGWKTNPFCVSQIMVDVVEMISDFYHPENFVQFAQGARFGLSMVAYSEENMQEENLGTATTGWMNSKDHVKGRVFAKRIKEYLLQQTDESLLLCGLEKRDGTDIYVILNGRPLHYGDFADHIPCE